MQKIRFTILLFSMLTAGCSKNKNPVPYVPVNITIYTTDPEFIDLNAVGNWIYITGGSKGIIVYRKSNSDFVALDRHGTIQSEKSCAVVDVDSNNITATEHCEQGKYLITDGSVVSGNTPFPLKQYQTTFDGTTLRITN